MWAFSSRGRHWAKFLSLWGSGLEEPVRDLPHHHRKLASTTSYHFVLFVFFFWGVYIFCFSGSSGSIFSTATGTSWRLGRSFSAAGVVGLLICPGEGWAVLGSKQAWVARHDEAAKVINVLLYPWQLGRGLIQAFAVFRESVALKCCCFQNFRVSNALIIGNDEVSVLRVTIYRFACSFPAWRPLTGVRSYELDTSNAIKFPRSSSLVVVENSTHVFTCQVNIYWVVNRSC